MPFPLIFTVTVENQQLFFPNNPAFFSVCEVFINSQPSIFNCQRCRVHMPGNIAHNIV